MQRSKADSSFLCLSLSCGIFNQVNPSIGSDYSLILILYSTPTILNPFLICLFIDCMLWMGGWMLLLLYHHLLGDLVHPTPFFPSDASILIHFINHGLLPAATHFSLLLVPVSIITLLFLLLLLLWISIITFS